ncbi:conserved hypothetical protein [Xenorhabdus bovienii str. oregonense]|uniref:DUF6575 domain-containing protein n=1 Tax=Xenorhabdus bovienii str. oregonense TaxID=1398202 RepID=A0A077PAU4_XENBV|nr:DUF6575 domain-containing protein [Xenorhabdus bovienii]CDH06821.1 conserved hypothetical protein [Xenorhabdus bovienii str. oregonense]
MSAVFLGDTHLGSLFMKNIYEYFEEPRFFSVYNEVGSLFIVYWIGDDDDYDKWLVIPISKERLEYLERKKIDIYASLVYQEQKYYYQVNRNYDDSVESVFLRLESKDIVTAIKMPKPQLYISGVTPVLDTGKLGKPVEFSTHEIHIEKSSNSTQPLVLSGVSKVFDIFNEFYNSILKSLDEKDVMMPVSGRPGSFALSFQADKMEGIEPLLKELNTVILHHGDIASFVRQRNIDVQILTGLFQSVIETSSNLELKSNSTDDLILMIRKTDAEFYIKTLAKLASEFVGGYQVPQANIITKVFEIVNLKWQDKRLNLQSTGLDDRHILYYIHAAKVLGFISNSGTVTALGQQLAEASQDRRLRIAARSFESSHCGWAWVTWSGANNINGIDPKTAEEFLLDKCLSLSMKTINRRASTLSQWCEALQPHYCEL